MALPSSIVPDPARLLLVFIAACIIAGFAWKFRSLGASGFLAATILGTVVVGGAGWWSGVLLISFFVSASTLSTTIHASTAVSTDRGNQRDAVQVAANGGVIFLIAITYACTAEPAWLFAIAGAIAAASADTWSTEIGRLSSSSPRLITTGRRVPTGTSGAISATGLAGAVTGAALIALVTVAGNVVGFFPTHIGWETTMITLTVAGFGGSLLDSLLGATIQEKRWCPECKKHTEKRIHTCGTPTRLTGGLRWVSNDVVNVSCTIVGATIAGIIAIIHT